MNYFDVDGEGHMNIAAFMEGLRGSLSPRRAAVVTKAFLSVNGSDACDLEELMEAFNVERMPEVMKGSMSVEEARVDFVGRLEGTRDSVHSHITLAEFVDYYSWLSASIVSDGSFISVLEAAWGVAEIDESVVRYEICCKAMKATALKKVTGAADEVKAKHVLLKTLRHFDLENKGGLSEQQFVKAAQRLCCSMDGSFAELFFQRFAGADGVLDCEAMADGLYREA